MLSISMPLVERSAYLRETYVIEGNKLPLPRAALDQAIKAAKAGGTTWHDFCSAWKMEPAE